MRVYCLGMPPTEIEGEDTDEYFSSFEAAKKRRADLIRQDNIAAEGDWLAVDRVELAALSPKALILAVLNRKGYVDTGHERVLEPHTFGLGDELEEWD